MTKMLNIVPEKCTGCMQCELACSWVQTGTFQPSRSVIRVNVFDEEASYAPYTCLQCDEAWCMTACPVNAIAVDESTGAKVVMENLCVGCHLCTIACPFGTVYTLPQTDKASKCNLCGGQPACATACRKAAVTRFPYAVFGIRAAKLRRPWLMAKETMRGTSRPARKLSR